MIDRDEAELLLEQRGHLFNGSGSDVGPVLRVYLDEYTGWPSFCTVTSGAAGQETLVALHEAEHRQEGDGIQVPYPQLRIDQAPTVGVDQDLSIAEEDALFEYYDVPEEGVLPSVEHLGSVLVPGPAHAGRKDGRAVDEHHVDHPPD